MIIQVCIEILLFLFVLYYITVILHFAGVQIDILFVTALLTMLSFSVHDTIIVFDRVREVSSNFRKKQMKDIINISLNQTLSRTVMTCSMTLSSLFALLLFGGSTIFTFTFIMFVGILLGPLSTFFVACPLLDYFHTREVAMEEGE